METPSLSAHRDHHGWVHLPGASPPHGDLLDEEEAVLLIRHGVRATAERFGCSARTLLRRFRKEGVSAREYLSETRCRLALRFLATHLPVATIAQRLGFSSPKTLARFLRREFGAPASDLRRRLLTSPRKTEPILDSKSI